ncbi:MAG TPA: hypothetical protein PKU78_06720 [Candidatus Dojkabacteria bacterium]|nr:hypothetical protein [Candidatus Dojkabacteria bacterium]
MKKLIYIFLSTLLLSSCEDQYTDDKVNSLRVEVKALREERQYLDDIIRTNKRILSNINSDLTSKRVELAALYKPNHKYILKISFKQSRVSLDIFEHMKDSMNAGNFEIPVDMEFYNSVEVGTQLGGGFRAGSFIMNGSFSNWDFRVEDKRIE